MKLGPIVGRGREAEVFEWDDGTIGAPKVLKLFYPGKPRDAIERDLEFSRIASGAGVSTPGVCGPLVEQDGRLGIVYERVDGQPMLGLMTRQPLRIMTYSHIVADLHFDLHRPRVSGLRSVKDKLKGNIDRATTITDDEKSRLKDLTDSMPDGERLYHGDFHPDNVIYRSAEQGGPVIIDWANAGCGDPLADVARTRLLTMFGWRGLPNGFNKWVARWFSGLMYHFYSKRYFELSGADAAGVT